MQPPMPCKFWEATVKKMKEKFGVPTPDAHVAALVDYLSATYGGRSASVPLAVSQASCLPSCISSCGSISNTSRSSPTRNRRIISPALCLW